MIPAAILVGGTALLWWIKVRPPRVYRCRQCLECYATRDERWLHFKKAHLS